MFKTFETMNKNGHKIIVQEMVHVAPKEFYDIRYSEWNNYDKEGYVHYAEGVKVPEKINGINESYKVLADIVGFDVQKSSRTLNYKNLVFADLKWKEMNPIDKMKITSVINLLKIMEKIINSAINSADSEEKKTEFSNNLRKTFIEVFKKDKLDKESKNFFSTIFNGLIIDKRNKKVVNAAMNDKRNVILPWGKAHSEGMLKILSDNGYKIISEYGFDMMTVLGDYDNNLKENKFYNEK